MIDSDSSSRTHLKPLTSENPLPTYVIAYRVLAWIYVCYCGILEGDNLLRLEVSQLGENSSLYQCSLL